MSPSNDAVCVDKLPRHLYVSAGLVDEGEVEGDFIAQIHLIVWDTVQLLCRHGQSLLVIMNSQMCEAHLMQRSAQVVHALLTLSTQLHVPPQEGKTLQHHSMSLAHKLLRRHVEEGEAHTEAVERVVRPSLKGLDVLT